MEIFKSRLTEPSTTNKNWIKTTHGGYNYCININNGSCLPNCVGYAWGRWRELLGTYHNLSRGNAENWYGNTGDGYKRGNTPKLGAVICWRKGAVGNENDGAGHVAIVEKINSDGSIVTSESVYGGARFRTRTYQKSNNYYLGSSYTFQGFIYPPVEFKEENEKYLNLSPNESSWTVYKTNNYYIPTKTSDVLIKLNPKKYGGLTYKILEDMGNYHFKIKTDMKGIGYISGNPRYDCTITDKPIYKEGNY